MSNPSLRVVARFSLGWLPRFRQRSKIRFGSQDLTIVPRSSSSFGPKTRYPASRISEPLIVDDDPGLRNAGEPVEELPGQELERRVQADVAGKSADAGTQQGERDRADVQQVGMIKATGQD